MIELELFFGIAGIIGLIPLGVYIIHLIWYSPKLFLRFPGNYNNPIPFPSGKIFTFGVSTDSDNDVLVKSVSIKYNPADVDVSHFRDWQKQMTTDKDYPLEILLNNVQSIRKKCFAVYGLVFTPKNKGKSVSFIFEVQGQLNGKNLPPLIDMLQPRVILLKQKQSFVETESEERMEDYSLTLKPQESIQIVGELSKLAVNAKTEKGEAKVDVIQVIEGEDHIGFQK